ncbi:MAG: hypothetical protein IKI66_11035 [Bacteroidales bacterium]|nr:hypothetical protein [Bacteroidales bacterium]
MMKMRLYIFFTVVLAYLATACAEVMQSDSSTDYGSKMVTEKILAINGDVNTKVTIDADAKFAWTKGDNLAVHVSSDTDHKYVVTSSGASAAAAAAAFEVMYDEGYTRDAFAIFPSTIVVAAAANYGQSGASLDVTLPGSYTLAQVTGEKTPCPMIAANTPGSNWTFYQLCGLLRLTVNGIPSSSKRLEISFDGKNVAGKFSVPSPVKGDGSSKIALENASGSNSSVITITKDGTDVVLGITSLVANIPLPVGEYTNFTVTAYDALTVGNVTLTLTRPFAYTASNLNATKRTASSPSSMTAFRGYEVSTGILKRDGSTTPATYSLTSGAMILTADPVTGAEYYSLPAGCNPFEPAVYYGNNDNRDKYFHMWLNLRGELDASGNDIKTDSERLPSGWYFPSGGGDSTDWGKILFGAPKSTITVNGAAITSKAYAMVSVSLDAGNSYGVAARTYYGLFLLRDGSTIPSGYFNKIGDADYTENPVLSETQFNELIQLGCLFISASGYYSTKFNAWRELNASWQYGYYWSNKYYSSTKFYSFRFSNANKASASTLSDSSNNNYYVVKLVKPVTD